MSGSIDNKYLKNEKYLILIVDDNAENIKIIASYLKRDDADIVISTEGAKALTIAEEKRPDLIILDIMMPGMDGYEVCAKLKASESTKDIPVIFITGKTEREEISKAYSTGAADVILKPIIINELRTKVNNLLRYGKDRNEYVSLKTGIKNLEEELGEFLSIAAHDLKNPIYSISMLAKVIRDEHDLTKEDITEFSGDIVTISERMLALIKNLLDINAIEQGKIKINMEEFPLIELLNHITETYISSAEEKQIKLIREYNGLEISVYADRSGVLQILDNLVSNAIKYSPFNKNVWIKASTVGDKALIEVKAQGA